MVQRGVFTYVYVIDERKDPKSEFLFSAYGTIPPGQNLERYFKEQGVFDLKTFRVWMKKSSLTETKQVGPPTHHIWEDYLIKVTIGKKALRIEVPRMEELELHNPAQPTDAYSQIIGRSGTPQVEIGGIGHTKKDLMHTVAALKKQGYTDEQIEFQLPGYKNILNT